MNLLRTEPWLQGKAHEGVGLTVTVAVVVVTVLTVVVVAVRTVWVASTDVKVVVAASTVTVVVIEVMSVSVTSAVAVARTVVVTNDSVLRKRVSSRNDIAVSKTGMWIVQKTWETSSRSDTWSSFAPREGDLSSDKQKEEQIRCALT
jgi:hypothetical protein